MQTQNASGFYNVAAQMELEAQTANETDRELAFILHLQCISSHVSDAG